MRLIEPDPDRDSMFVVVYAVAATVLLFLFMLWLVSPVPAHAVESFYMSAERFVQQSTSVGEKLAYLSAVMNTLQVAGELSCPRVPSRG